MIKYKKIKGEKNLVEIKIYQKTHLEQILEFQKALYEENFKDMEYDIFFFYEIARWYHLAEKSQEFCAYVMEIDGEIKGFYLYKTEKNEAYLMQMFIEKSIQNKGFGKKLIQHFKQMTKDKTRTLHVSKMNAKAVQFYEKQGFIKKEIEYDQSGDIRYFMTNKK